MNGGKAIATRGVNRIDAIRLVVKIYSMRLS